MAKRIYKLLSNPTDTPENPLTRERLLNWLASTNWIEGYIRKNIHDLDRKYVGDYIQEIWCHICSIPENKLMEIWYRGKGKFINYIKSLIDNNIRSTSSNVYRIYKVPEFAEQRLDDDGWMTLRDLPDPSLLYLNDGKEKIDLNT